MTDDAGIPAVVDPGFPRLFGRLAELGVEPAGPPFIRYLRTGAELEIELGIPVGPDAGQPAAARRPGRRAAPRRAVHRPARGLRGGCRRGRGAGRGARGPFWESYVTNPREEPDSSRWITDILQPLR